MEYGRIANSVTFPDIESKVAFLSRPEIYPDVADRMEVVETHLSWVFLTPRYVYKLKKPVARARLDFTSLAARHHNCVEEVRLNRRLAGEVYIGVITLRTDAEGVLQLGGEGTAVDWLVHMRRLPARCMLDRMIKAGSVGAADLLPVARLLADFYASAAPVRLPGEIYRQRLERDIRGISEQLCNPLYGLSASGFFK